MIISLLIIGYSHSSYANGEEYVQTDSKGNKYIAITDYTKELSTPEGREKIMSTFLEGMGTRIHAIHISVSVENMEAVVALVKSITTFLKRTKTEDLISFYIDGKKGLDNFIMHLALGVYDDVNTEYLIYLDTTRNETRPNGIGNTFINRILSTLHDDQEGTLWLGALGIHENLDSAEAAIVENLLRTSSEAIQDVYLDGVTNPIDINRFSIALEQAKMLSFFVYNNNNIGDEGAHQVAYLLSGKPELCHLELANNQIGYCGIKAIASVIGGGEVALDTFDLDNNSISDRGAITLISALQQASSAGGHRPPLTLYLHGNSISHKGTIAIAKAMQSINLENLDLSFNSIKDEGAMALAQALQVNTSLKCLYLDNTDITDEGAMALAQAVQYNTHSELEQLSLKGNNISPECKRNILKLLSKNVNLSTIELELGQADQLNLNERRTKPLTEVRKRSLPFSGTSSDVTKPPSKRRKISDDASTSTMRQEVVTPDQATPSTIATEIGSEDSSSGSESDRQPQPATSTRPSDTTLSTYDKTGSNNKQEIHKDSNSAITTETSNEFVSFIKLRERTLKYLNPDFFGISDDREIKMVVDELSTKISNNAELTPEQYGELMNLLQMLERTLPSSASTPKEIDIFTAGDDIFATDAFANKYLLTFKKVSMVKPTFYVPRLLPEIVGSGAGY